MSALRTDQLERGTRVVVSPGIVRTVDTITSSPYLNYRNEPILYVRYVEASTAEWSHGNSAIGSSLWTLEHVDGCPERYGWQCECI